ncbi:MAG: DUF2075 domain-containing protein [Erysipelothrix sp.]|nr:DUF2075 domain-containing protein [Erysipelothrix sp.]
MRIISKEFTKAEIEELGKEKYGKNWPVVYILHDEKKAYVGETTSIFVRAKQHLDNDERKQLTMIEVISDKMFNKSAALDIEAKLIEYMSSDEKYKLLNSNGGIRGHDYYDKERYDSLFKTIWAELRKKEIVENDLRVLENSDLFKYTPYKTLTDEQYETVYLMISDLARSIMNNQEVSFIINGEAGTGKTVLAMYLLKLLSDNKLLDFITDFDEEQMNLYVELKEKLEDFRFALVVPQTSLRATLKSVVGKITNLKKNMVIGPSDVTKQDYDLLIVDEAHRLKRSKNISHRGAFNQTNSKLELGDSGTQLDWVMKSSKYQIFFYDAKQSIRPSDVRPEQFEKLITNQRTIRYHLRSQLRSKGGNDYLKYIKEILSDQPPSEKRTFASYDFRLYDSIWDMREQVFKQEEADGLSRLVAGYAWNWVTQKMSPAEITEQGAYDIEIEGLKMIWNSGSGKGWINSPGSVNEVGSIHTTQGFDLNYVGVIIGPEVTYNWSTQKIEVIKENYYDKYGKQSIEDERELHDYVMNIYGVLLSRAMNGTYVYVCDPELKKYFEKYINK